MLLFVQLVVLTLGFIWLMPIRTSAFLENAAGGALQIRAAVLLLFVGSALGLGIAIAAFPVLRGHSYGLTLWLLSFSIIWLLLQAIDNAYILSMLSLSEQYAEGGFSNVELSEVLAEAIRSIRRRVHYTVLLAIDCWFIVFYSLILRSSLVPRLLAGFGLIMVIVHTVAIPVPVFLGFGSVLELAYSMALSYLAMGTWLVVKGFDERHRRTGAEAQEIELFGT